MKQRLKGKTRSPVLLAKWPATIAAAHERGGFTASVKMAAGHLGGCDAQRSVAELVKLRPLTKMSCDDVISLYLLNYELARAVAADNVAGSKAAIQKIESQVNRIARA